MEGEEETKKENEGEAAQEGEAPPQEAEPPPQEAEPPPQQAEPPPQQAEPPPQEAEPPPQEAQPPPLKAEPPPEQSKPEESTPPSEEQKPPAEESTPLTESSGKSGSILRAAEQKSRTSQKSAGLNEALGKGGSRKGFSSVANFTTGNFNCATFFQKRSPFVHNPPQPEERRERIDNPRTPREYIINLREDLADFQESHGLPRTRDYSFMSLGMALAQETARALCSLFLMFAELFPIVAIVSLIMRFALDKIIEILETDEPVPKAKKSILFALQMLVIIIPLWILIGTIIIPLITLMFSIVRKMVRFKGRKCSSGTKTSKTTCKAFDYLRLLY